MLASWQEGLSKAFLLKLSAPEVREEIRRTQEQEDSAVLCTDGSSELSVTHPTETVVLLTADLHRVKQHVLVVHTWIIVGLIYVCTV